MAQPSTVRSTHTAPATAPKRAGTGWLTGVTMAATVVVGFALAWIPPVASGITHVIERISNHFKAKKELDARADWYRNQVATTLGIDPAKVKGKHLVEAANYNPVLAAAVKDVRREEAKENKTSAAINTATAFIPAAVLAKEAVGAAAVVTRGAAIANNLKHMGKVMAATTASGMLVSWTSKDHLSAQEVIEGIGSQLEAAKEQGVNPRKAVTPQMVFLLRVAQDEALGKEIETHYKKPFHKMELEEQSRVMQAYMPLANAVTSEAYAVANDMLPVQELMARAPNLNSTARYSVGAQASSFAQSELNRRAAAGTARPAANQPNFAASEAARREAAARSANALQA